MTIGRFAQIARKLAVVTHIGSAVLTLLLIAQPWNDFHANKDIAFYGMLAGLICFAIAPNVGLLLAMYIVRNDRNALATFSVGSALISLSGEWLYVHVTFVHVYKLGAMAFMQWPIAQWIAGTVVLWISLVMKEFNRLKAFA